MQKGRISILIIEDLEQKKDRFMTVLRNLEIPEEDICCVESSIAAEKEMMETQYDIVLLDLVLPPWNKKPAERDGGQRLMQRISAIPDKFKMPRYIFIISEYDDAVSAFLDDPAQFYIKQIKYDATSIKWEKELASYIGQIWRARNDSGAERIFDVAIVCALRDPELNAVLNLPFNWTQYKKPTDFTNYFSGTYCEKRILCAAAYEMGMPAASIISTKISENFRPSYIIMTGIAAGVDSKKLHFGDILIADPCFDYGSGKRSFEAGEPGKSVFCPDYNQRRLDGKVLQLFEQFAADDNISDRIGKECPGDIKRPAGLPHIHIGDFASGAAVLTDPSVISGILEHARKLLGFDMEAYGVMLAGDLSSEPKSIPVIIKAVSDFGDQEKSDDYHAYAAYTSAKMAQIFIENICIY